MELVAIWTQYQVLVFVGVLTDDELVHGPAVRSGEVYPLEGIQFELVAAVLETCLVLAEDGCDA